jgi:hypothetical protein
MFMYVDISGWQSKRCRRIENATSIHLQYSLWKDAHVYSIDVRITRDRCFVLLISGFYRRLFFGECGTVPDPSDKFPILLREIVMSFLQKVEGAAQVKSVLTSQVDESLSKKYPALYEYLTADKYPDGSSRETATLSISTADDGYKFCLRDRDCARCLWVTTLCFFDGLKALDAGLRSGDAPWVKDRFSTNGNVKQGSKKKV